MSSIQQALYDLIVRQTRLPRERLTADATLKTLDIRSLDGVQLLCDIEDRFGVVIPEGQADYATGTLDDLLHVIEAELAKKDVTST